MKKYVAFVFALALATSVAMAAVGISWSTQYGVYDHNASDLTGGSNAMLDSYSAIWQLIYAGANNAIDSIPAGVVPSAGTAIIDDNYVYGDDVVWAQRTIAQGGGVASEDGTSWDNWMLNNPAGVTTFSSSWSTAGFVYQRIFETTVFGTVSNGDYYHESGLFAYNASWPGAPTPPDGFLVDFTSGGVQPTTQITAIPEPATMSLLGLGALVMAIRRRRA